jgi:hypothetical protein
MRNHWNLHNSNQIRPEELSDTIMEGLREYAKLASEDMKDAVKETAKDVKKDIQSGAPVDKSKNAPHPGRYKKSWKTKKLSETAESLDMVVYAGDYQISHLLENGHAKRGGGRVAAIPHIKPAEEKGAKELEEKITEALEAGS